MVRWQSLDLHSFTGCIGLRCNAFVSQLYLALAAAFASAAQNNASVGRVAEVLADVESCGIQPCPPVQFFGVACHVRDHGLGLNLVAHGEPGRRPESRSTHRGLLCRSARMFRQAWTWTRILKCPSLSNARQTMPVRPRMTGASNRSPSSRSRLTTWLVPSSGLQVN